MGVGNVPETLFRKNHVLPWNVQPWMGHGRRGHHGHPVALSAFSIEDAHAQTLLPGNQKDGTVLGGICRAETAQTDFAKERMSLSFMVHPMRDQSRVAIGREHGTLMQRLKLLSHMTLPFISSLEL